MKMLSPLLVALAALFGCGGTQPAPEATPVKVAAVEPPGEENSKAQEKSGQPAPATDEARAEAVAKALSEVELNVLGALGSSDTSAILSAGDVPKDLLDAAAASAPGVDSVVRQGGGGLVGRPAPAPREQLTGLYTAGRTDIGPVSVSKGTFSDPDGQVARHRALFAGCYRQARRGNSTHMGTLEVEFDVNPSGRVEAARTATRRGLHASVARCVEQGSQSLQFDRPPTGVTLTFVVRFDP